MGKVGFEPTKPKQQIYSLPTLTTCIPTHEQRLKDLNPYQQFWRLSCCQLHQTSNNWRGEIRTHDLHRLTVYSSNQLSYTPIITHICVILIINNFFSC